ncbi:hypothetical protein N7468_006225 [Penicillium chermesinum]|uniref:DUF7614 domain-containing protein n=1 Tax=Penicillium chermesinum TaxID=63820 RepID=A0A9W9NRW4_9EURO|nr:uncharacterized protein N7468_006225 [Penicillium chermesinum]KAJ5225000.1 hypothetical protein N7468_006225 [Penicillium chermesinum]
MVVPIYKKWEASSARLQVVRQDKTIQLLAFFPDFHYGTCMNFVLKGTDQIEAFNRSGKYGLRIVDAKFALPKKDDDPSSNFVCLDMPEYPIEHDDISITFENDAGMSCLFPLRQLKARANEFVLQIAACSRRPCLGRLGKCLGWGLSGDDDENCVKTHFSDSTSGSD